jgi:hypothetical protein
VITSNKILIIFNIFKIKLSQKKIILSNLPINNQLIYQKQTNKIVLLILKLVNFLHNNIHLIVLIITIIIITMIIIIIMIIITLTN